MVEIAQVKSLPRVERNELLKKGKGIEGRSLRQALGGVSLSLISWARGQDEWNRVLMMESICHFIAKKSILCGDRLYRGCLFL
jgi:hypothetical protein